MKTLLATVALSLMVSTGGAATTVTAQQAQTPPPACPGEKYREFDFWVGEWNVYQANNGRIAGENSIQPAEDGCVLWERWDGAGGGGGSSINYYDPITDEWRQVWHSRGAGGYLIDISGNIDPEDGALALEGEIHYYGSGGNFPFRGRWTPLEDGNVRQQFWQYNAQTDQWTPWFDGIYVRKENDRKGIGDSYNPQ